MPDRLELPPALGIVAIPAFEAERQDEEQQIEQIHMLLRRCSEAPYEQEDLLAAIRVVMKLLRERLGGPDAGVAAFAAAPGLAQDRLVDGGAQCIARGD